VGDKQGVEIVGCEVTPSCFGQLTQQLMELAQGRVVLALEGERGKEVVCPE
jgi:hypothetical protein